jgi:phosphoribosylaminoimidazole-succinocarboxamide synthase
MLTASINHDTMLMEDKMTTKPDKQPRKVSFEEMITITDSEDIKALREKVKRIEAENKLLLERLNEMGDYE